MPLGGKIKILDLNTVNKIAAGEVVENPASVVKELIENSIDAKAKRIVVDIREGGKKMIKVTDDGIGMDKDDAVLAFKRHATSKISKSEDLFKIYTLGFRGEALPSIAAVAWVKMLTKAAHMEAGTCITLKGGEIEEVKDVGIPNGTTVEVKHLFYNVPARKKYLKTTAWETAAISNIVTRYALAHPDIAFIFRNNNRTVFTSMGSGDLFDVIVNVFGKNAAKNMISVDFRNEMWKVYGYISKPEESRKNRKYQCIVVNGRVIKNTEVSKAIERGYEKLLPKARYPIFVLHMDLPPDRLDVNIHPSKTEIKFDSELEFLEFLSNSVSGRLRNNNILPKIDKDVFRFYAKKTNGGENDKTEGNTEKTGFHNIELNFDSNKKNNDEAGTSDSYKQTFSSVSDGDLTREYINPNKVFENQTQYNDKGVETLPLMHPIGQVFNTYIIAQSNEDLYIIDQHAAHERIFYEKFKKEFLEGNKGYSQQIIDPIVVELNEEEKVVIEENTQYFKSLGFDFEPFGDKSYIIRGIPAAFKGNVNHNTLLEIINDIMEFGKNVSQEEKLLIIMSCRAAIKAGDELHISEMKKLLSDLRCTKNPYTCPHGRPSIIKMNRYDLEKKFLRRG